MGTRVSYPLEVKEEAILQRMACIPVAEVMNRLGIINKTQLKTWMKWYRNGENHRLHLEKKNPTT